MRKSVSSFKLSETNVLSTGQAAKILGVSSRTMSKWLDSGIVHSWKVNKDRRILREQLFKLAEIKGMPILHDKKTSLDFAADGDALNGENGFADIRRVNTFQEQELNSLREKIENMKKVIRAAEDCLNGGKFICAENCYKVEKQSRNVFFDQLRSIRSFYI